MPPLVCTTSIKEIVQRTYTQPGGAELLEHLIGVIAHAERNLTGERREVE